MQHKNTQNLTKKYRISAVCKHLLMIQLSKTRTGTMTSVIYKWEEEIEGEQISSLQVAVSSMSDQTDMVVVGVICYDKSALEEEASE